MHIPLREGDGDAFGVEAELDLFGNGISDGYHMLDAHEGAHGQIDAAVAQGVNGNNGGRLFDNALLIIHDLLQYFFGFQDVVTVANAVNQVQPD
jgi:hypothetical protein